MTDAYVYASPVVTAGAAGVIVNGGVIKLALSVSLPTNAELSVQVVEAGFLSHMRMTYDPTDAPVDLSPNCVTIPEPPFVRATANVYKPPID